MSLSVFSVSPLKGQAPAGTRGFSVGSNSCCWLGLRALPVVVLGREIRTRLHARGDSRKGLKGTGSGKEEHGTGWRMRRRRWDGEAQRPAWRPERGGERDWKSEAQHMTHEDLPVFLIDGNADPGTAFSLPSVTCQSRKALDAFLLPTAGGCAASALFPALDLITWASSLTQPRFGSLPPAELWSRFRTPRCDLARPAAAEASRLLSFHGLFLDTSFSQALTNGRVAG